MDKIDSNLYNLKTIIEKDFSFNIPRYQRLYVWGEEQVNTLFHDILTAALSEKELYYIGGIITVKYEKIERCFDLVDGQQRFTTLWLLANELGADLEAFTRRDGDLRLNFSIRENVKNYFNQLSIKTLSEENGDNDYQDLERISKARKTLQYLILEYLKKESDKNIFIDFVLNKLQMVMTQVPPQTDLNKLFETLNNRGLQLAQHEILKARLLAKIQNKNQRYRYNVLWNACSDMDNYLERSMAYEMGSAKEIANSYNDWQHDWEYVKDFLKNKASEKPTSLSLRSILQKRSDLTIDSNHKTDDDFFHPKAEDDELEKVRSILTFPQLLLHTLRIFLFNNEREDIQRINEKELLAIFKQHLFLVEKDSEKQSLAFIDLLLKVREVFDAYIIKWVKEDDNDETHLIKTVRKQNQKKYSQTYYLRRQKTKTEELNGLALLQSILYHSQQNTTQYWLTPFLNFLLTHPSFAEAYLDLKKIDNILFSSLQENNLTERTWACMEDYPNVEPTTDILELENLGTKFPHYWFYKMEFVLWHERAELEKNEESWNNYKMTARNSIEHISPQNPRESKDKLCIEELDNFGNLVLVTRSINSEYSDLPYSVKRAKFLDKKQKGKIDSLKSDIIYASNNWGDDEAFEHQEEMIQLMKNYFNKTMQHD